MFETEYNDIFTDVNKAKEIMQKAISELTELFTERVKDNLTDIKFAEKNLADISAEMEAKQRQCSYLQNEIEELKERIDNFEEWEAPQRYINKFVEKATKGFCPGQTVYYVKKKFKQFVCPTCNERNKITVTFNGKLREIRCPDCLNGYQMELSYEVVETVVQDIYLRLCFNKDGVSYWNFENIFLRDTDNYTPADMVFATREEAEAKAKEWNEGEVQNG